jgi:hypothetical protein
MRLVRTLVVSLPFVFGIVAAAAAQEPHASPSQEPSTDTPFVAPLTQSQDRELRAWLSRMDKWLRDEQKYLNKPRHDRWARPVGHEPRPTEPAWLPAHCLASAGAGVLELQESLARACRLLDDSPMPSTQQMKAVDAEKPAQHTSFLTRLHIDGLWTTASTTGRIYGLVGSHMSLVDVGRLQVFGPPGVILLSVPDVNGSRRITLGYTWGVSLRLADMRLFGQRDMTLFLNLSKVWVNGSTDNATAARGFEAIGFSLAPRKKR